MVDFRKFLLALVVGALMFASFASADPFACTATAVPPIVRAEGLAELVGDIVLVCSGNPAGPITANIRISLNTNVTSDVESTSVTPNILESLLLLDEGANQLVAYNSDLTTRDDGTQNLYQGVKVSDREVEWQEVMLFASGSQPTQVIRLTDVRANAQGLGTGGQVTAHINITGTATVPVTNNNLNVADIRQGVWMSVTPIEFKRCIEPDREDEFTLTFTEGGGPTNPTILSSAFKWKGPDAANTIPGIDYYDESGFIPFTTGGTARFTGSLLAVGTTKPGFASQGTRLVAEISGIPAGVTLTVPNVITEANLTAEYVKPSSAWAAFGTFPNYAAGTLQTSGSTTLSAPISGGKVAIVYEVSASNEDSLGQNEHIDIPVEVSFDPQNSDANLLGTATASGSFAPVSSKTTASSTEAEPRFVYSTPNPQTVLTIGPCRTILLFPYLTNAPGFDTGLAISNTSSDPLGTQAQAGTCGLNFYGTKSGAALTAAQAAQVTPSIPSGGQFIMLLSAAVGSVIDPSGATPAACASGQCMLPGFQGYMFAVCNFQFAHGFAFVSDLGATKLAMGYLALVVPDRMHDGRLPAASSLHDRNNQGEQLAQ